MFIICERPWTTQKLAFYARKKGKYQRPIIGHLIDFRIEDILPSNLLQELRGFNIMGKLPDIPQANQVNKYFISIFNDLEIVDKDKANRLFNTQEFVVLPSDSSSSLWRYVKGPWWEYVVVLDEYEGYIKAPREDKTRAGEPSPDDIDEQLDLYENNVNNINVISPVVIKRWADDHLSESYIAKLRRL